MSTLTPQQIGICSWSLAPKDPEDLANQLEKLGLAQIQLALDSVRLGGPTWANVRTVLAKRGIRIASGMFGCKNEDYTTLESIRRTGGMVPDENWPDNLKIATESAKIAADLGLKVVSTHAGFLPEDPSDPKYATLQDRLAQVAALLKDRGMQLLFETGQETAQTLSAFLADLSKKADNVGVNFDPANMILYGKGEPVASLQRLLAHVKQVHIKDATATTQPGTWGKEVPAGEGDVDWAGFIKVLDNAGFSGGLIIEREAGANRIADAKKAIALLTTLMGAAGI